MTYGEFEGKTALITGSGNRKGIGFAIAEKMASCGVNVIIADLGNIPSVKGTAKFGTWESMQDNASELKSRYGVTTFAVCVDVTQSTSIAQMIESIKGHFDHIDVLCNNAGAVFGVPSEVHNYDETAWMRTIDVNLHGVFRVSKMVIPLLIGWKGSIINISSRAGKFPRPLSGAYSVAKAGIIMLTKVMAKELAGSGIRINAICPGQIMTDLAEAKYKREAEIFNTTVEDRIKKICETIPLQRIGSPREVADLVAFLASDSSSYITGQAINITGGQLMEL